MSFMQGDKVSRPRTRRLRTHLARMTFATLLPVLVLAAVLSWLLVMQEQATFERGARERVRALVSAVDAELRISIEALRVLADSESLLADDLAGFHERIARIESAMEPWSNINLALPSGERVVSALQPFGELLNSVQERESFDAVLRTREPQIGSLVVGDYMKTPVFTVRLPVLRGGEVRYVLSAVVKPLALQRLLMAQGLPPDWVGTVVDAKYTIVARTVDPDAMVGRTASQRLRDALAGASSEGSYRGRTLEGYGVYSSFHRSALSGWAVVIGVPLAAVEAGAWRAAGLVAGGAALALALALLLSRLLGRGISQPIAELAAQARALASDGVLAERPVVRSGIAEVGDLDRTLRDAAEAVRARDDTRRQLASLTDNATVALFMTDANRHCSFMNPAAERMTGYTLVELHDRPLHDAIHHQRPDGSAYPRSECPIDRALLENDRQQGEDVFVHASGRFYPVAYTASPIRVDGVPVGTVVEVRDITAERAAHAERLRLLQSEQEARAESDAANRAKDHFLAMLGHELRNPLSAISNAAYLLERRSGVGTAEHDPAARPLGVIRRQLVHVTRLVDDLLDASRVSTGKIALNRRPLDLAALVRHIAQAVCGAASTARHRLVLDLQPTWVEGDETRLEQVVTNLLSNAVRYTPAGGRIELTLRSEHGAAVLGVRDDGIGMAQELLKRVFDLFAQGERGIERAQGGLGIGLTLARRLAELHGGSVDAASDGPGLGSVFRLRLPAIAPPAGAAAADTAMVRGPSRRILIVEDNDDAREMLRALLEHAGHRVSARADGPSGLEAALALQPEVALIDVGLPGLSGPEVAERIRAHPRGQAVMLVAVTGYGQPEDRARSQAAGFDLHAVKPVDVESLMQSIEAALLARPHNFRPAAQARDDDSVIIAA